MQNESALLNEIVRALYPYARLYRINVIRVKNTQGRWLTTGVPKGYSDLSGYRIGDGRAVYIECKIAPNKPTTEQETFLARAREHGAIAGVCYSVEDAFKLIGVG